MRYLFLFILTGSFFFSCEPSAVYQSFSGTDSLVIHFKNEKENRITKTVQTTDSKAIRRILEFIDNQPTDSAACGFDGKMFFYRQRERIQEVDFNIKDSRCSRFSLILDGQLISTKLSGEAADFLGALERGDLFY